jgi:hypothetical protein
LGAALEYPLEVVLAPQAAVWVKPGVTGAVARSRYAQLGQPAEL